jgi:hypothetical protein
MATYELDDDLVREWVTTARALGTVMDGPLADALEKQLPIPAPILVGAVVECDVQLTHGDTTFFVRYDDGPGNTYPWVRAGAVGEVYNTSEIGRIVKVWSEGVDV